LPISLLIKLLIEFLDRKPSDQNTNPFPSAGPTDWAQNNSMFLRAFPPGQKLRGDIRWPRRNYDPQAPSPEVSFEYDTASPAAFQPRTA
jgi:hypothetical protein